MFAAGSAEGRSGETNKHTPEVNVDGAVPIPKKVQVLRELQPVGVGGVVGRRRPGTHSTRTSVANGEANAVAAHIAFTLICFIFICFFSIFFCSRR